MNTPCIHTDARFRISLGQSLRVLSVSDGVQDLLGFGVADFVGGRVALQQLIHRQDSDIAALLFEPLADARPCQLNVRLRDARGKVQCLKGVFTKETSAEGLVLDLSLRAAKASSHAQDTKPMMTNFRAMMENTEDYIYFKDRHHVFTGASQTLVQLTAPANHWSDLIGLTDYDVFPEDLADVYYELEKQVFAGVPVAREVQEIRSKDGKEGWVDNRKYPIKDESGAIIGLFGIARDITATISADARQQLQLELIQGILKTALDGFWLVDVQGRLVDVNAAACAMLGYSREEMLVLTVPDIEVTDSPEDVKRRIEAMQRAGGARFESQHRRKDGRTVDVEVSISFLAAQDSFSVFVRDISQRKESEDQLRVAATAFDSQEGVLITDANSNILRVNKAFTTITGYSEEEVKGGNPRILSSGRHDAAFYADLWHSVNTTGAWQGEIWNRRKNGEVFPEWQQITAVKDARGVVTHFVGSFADITSRKAAESEIAYLAFYDPLTRLPNRRLLQDRLKQALALSGRSKAFGALMFIDLDNFKGLNDTLGHHFGDMLLEQVAHRLSQAVREGDTVARLGGDEFVVMLEGVSDTSEEAAAHCELVGQKILASLGQPYLLGDKPYNNSCSIGITLFSDKHSTSEELLKQADMAMYEAKACGRNGLRFFDPAMQDVVAGLAAMEADLREALARDEFVLYYQPQVQGESHLTGAEALIRWKHPVRGFVSPAAFIGPAEDTGLIFSIGRWVLKTACNQLAQWSMDKNLCHLTMAVNVSAKQFRQAGFVQEVMDVLAQTGANPRQLKIELTESLLVVDVEDIISKMSALKAMGVSFSLDDFGTGYSSLSYLKRLPLDQLKIDQGFVRDMLTDPNDAAIARMVTALSESLGIVVIAEGVEQEAQRVMLEQMGCSHYQGYLFGRPMQVGDFEIYAKGLAAHTAGKS